MTHVLYGYKGSGSAAAEAALRRAGVEHRIVDAATWAQDSALGELRRVNPLQQIPALVFPDGGVMSESAAILIELGLRHPASGLLPTEPAKRAQAIRGLVYIAANCYSAIGLIDYPERYVQQVDDDVRKRIVAGTKARLHAMWDAFADQFTLDAERPGALEILAAVVSQWSGTRKHLSGSRPAFLATIEAIEKDAVLAAVLARHRA